MLENTIHNNTLKDWGISIIIIIAAIIISRLLSLLNRRFILKWVKKTKTKLDDILFSSLEAPILLGIILLGIWIATMRLDLGAKTSQIIATSYKILVSLNVTWFVARFIGSLLEDYSTQTKKKQKGTKTYIDKRFKPLVRRVTMVFIWSIGIIMALNNVGISVGALLGTLGIGGIAIALAAQDTVKNVIGGLTLFTDQPFRIGDRIQFDSIDGNVVDIGIRSTRIRTLDKRLLTIPNYKIVDAAIVNINSEPRRRIVIKLALTYETEPGKMREALDILRSIPKYVEEVDEKDLSATFNEFGDSALIINYIYFIKKSSPNIFESISKVNFEILNRFKESGVNFAYPTQTVYIGK